MRYLALALAALVLSTAASSADDVGCYTADVEWMIDGSIRLHNVESDPGVEHASVGPFAWIRYDAVEDQAEYDWSTYDNVVSYEVPAGTDFVKICTTYWEAETYIEADAGTTQVYVTDDPVVVAPVLEPHPSIAEAWINERGLTIL